MTLLKCAFGLFLFGRNSWRRRVATHFVGAIALLWIAGCSLFVTEDFFGERWQGRSLQEIEDAWGLPAQSLNKDNGEMEIRYDLFKGTCRYYFIVNREGKIVGHRYESPGLATCKPIG